MTSILAPRTLAPRVAASRAQLTAAAYTVLRVGTGALFLQHGLQKLFGLLGGFMGTPGATAPLASLFGVAGAFELVGGTLLVLGLLTRPAALVLLGQMLYAFATVHAPQGGAPIQNGGELALLYAAIFAFIFVYGSGPLSLDAKLFGREARALS